MRSSIVALLLLATAASAEYRKALPGYQFEFPRDHFNHPEFRTEWWYFTGNLRDSGGHRLGYELTFFRHNIDQSERTNVWSIDDVWFAHFAVSDINGKRFVHTQRFNRAGAGLAGAEPGRVWNGNWHARWQGDSIQLRAVAGNFSVDFTLAPRKPSVVHGVNGVSQKAAGAGRASHYVSLTRIATRGALTLEGKRFDVEGASWMDHEFFTHSLESNQTGWDWFSLQFDDGSELMLYRLRRKDGSVEPYSSGTYVDAQGKSRHLRLTEFELRPGRKWKQYPVEWDVRVPSLGIDVKVTTQLDSQELTGRTTYWEGAMDVRGSHTGVGYLEMTGYEGAVRMGN